MATEMEILGLEAVSAITRMQNIVGEGSPQYHLLRAAENAVIGAWQTDPSQGAYWIKSASECLKRSIQYGVE